MNTEIDQFSLYLQYLMANENKSYSKYLSYLIAQITDSSIESYKMYCNIMSTNRITEIPRSTYRQYLEAKMSSPEAQRNCGKAEIINECQGSPKITPQTTEYYKFIGEIKNISRLNDVEKFYKSIKLCNNIIDWNTNLSKMFDSNDLREHLYSILNVVETKESLGTMFNVIPNNNVLSMMIRCIRQIDENNVMFTNIQRKTTVLIRSKVAQL